MPRGHVGIVGAPRRCLPLPYRVIYRATLLPHFFFSMQVTKFIPSHDHIHHALHRLWRSSGNCAFSHLAFLVCLVFPLPSHLLSPCITLLRSTLFTITHTHPPSFVVFSVSSGSSTVRNLWISSRRSLRGIAQCPLATCCLYVLPYLRCCIPP